MPYEHQLQKVISAMPQIIFYAKLDDHGIRRGNMGQIIAQWWRSVASRVALDLPYWEMRPASYRLIRTAFKTARKADPFLFFC